MAGFAAGPCARIAPRETPRGVSLGCGKTRAEGKGGCAVCPAGKFQDTPGSSSCQQCDDYTYQSAPGQDSCKPCSFFCPAGQFHTTCGSSESGECQRCPRGQFKAKGHGIACSSCIAGQFAASVGQEVCVSCDGATEFQDSTGESVCRTIRVCSKAEYETVAPTAASDRQCASHKECKNNEYEIASGAPTDFMDRVCAPHRVCTEHEHEIVAAGPKQDRQYKAHV